ncbi:MAG: TM2 domain-containing protein [Oscillospiraceae bacterium]|nr:TM2 domain-containing protein [Oscillospiraceae bacterium]
MTLQQNTAQNTYGNVTGSQKSKFIAGLLAILLGALGIHNFYLGYTKKAVAQILLFVFFLGWVSFIWGVVDGIMIFSDKITCDAKGVPLADNI